MNVLELNLRSTALRLGHSRPWPAGRCASTSAPRPASARRSPCSTRAGARFERGTDVVVGYVETHGRPTTAEQIDGLEVVPRRPLEYRGATLRGDGRRRHPRPPARRSRSSTSSPTRNVPGSAQREALAGRRGAARRRDRRDLDGQHPAPRVAQRRRRAHHRRQAARDDPRRRRAARRPDRARRHDARGAAPAHGPRQHLPGRERIDAALAQLLPRRQPRGAARARAAVGRRPRRRRARRTTASGTGSTEPWETRERVVVALTGAPGRRATRSAGPRGWRSAVEGRPARRARAAAATASPRPPAELLDEQRRAARGARRRRTTRSSAPTSAAALVDFARAENATQLVLGASRRSRWQRAHARVGHQPRRPRARASHRRARHLDRRPRTEATRARPRAAPSAGAARAAGAARLSRWPSPWSCPLLTCVLAPLRDEHRPADRAAALPAPRRRRRRDRWASAGVVAAVAGFLLANWFFTPPSTRSRSPRARTSSRSSCSSCVARRRQRARRRSRRAARPRRTRARREAETLAAARRLARQRRSARRPARPACGGVFGARRRSRCCDRDRRRVGGRGRRRAPRPAGAGAASAVDDARRRDVRPRARGGRTSAPTTAGARRVRAQLALRSSSAAPAGRGGDARRALAEAERAAHGAARGRLARPAHAARVDQGVGDEPAPGRTSSWTADGGRASSSTRSTTRPTGSTPSSATCST